MATKADSGFLIRLGFRLVSDFTVIELSFAFEPSRMANRICRQDHYTWKTICETGEAVSASDGISINVEFGIETIGALTCREGSLEIGGMMIAACFPWLTNRCQALLVF